MNKHDRNRFQHMLEGAKLALEFVGEESRETFDHDLKHQFAVIRAVEIIGEAAARVSDEGRQETQQLPWSSMIGMRNILIHRYFEIDTDQVWETIKRDLPQLIIELEAILAS